LNLSEGVDNWALASEAFYTETLKAYLENFALAQALSGYEIWLGFDWFAASNGTVTLTLTLTLTQS
jgi:hypothetical protein